MTPERKRPPWERRPANRVGDAYHETRPEQHDCISNRVASPRKSTLKPIQVGSATRIDGTKLVLELMSTGDVRVEVRRPDREKPGKWFSLGFAMLRPGELDTAIEALASVKRRLRGTGK